MLIHAVSRWGGRWGGSELSGGGFFDFCGTEGDEESEGARGWGWVESSAHRRTAPMPSAHSTMPERLVTQKQNASLITILVTRVNQMRHWLVVTHALGTRRVTNYKISVTLLRKRVTDNTCDTYYLGASLICGRISDSSQQDTSLIRKVTCVLMTRHW
jgi:hypothetical protein